VRTIGRCIHVHTLQKTTKSELYPLRLVARQLPTIGTRLTNKTISSEIKLIKILWPADEDGDARVVHLLLRARYGLGRPGPT
jgi:hypothetical protein